MLTVDTGSMSLLSCVLTSSEPQQKFSLTYLTLVGVFYSFIDNSLVRHCVLKIHKEHLKDNVKFCFSKTGPKPLSCTSECCSSSLLVSYSSSYDIFKTNKSF